MVGRESVEYPRPNRREKWRTGVPDSAGVKAVAEVRAIEREREEERRTEREGGKRNTRSAERQGERDTHSQSPTVA